MPRYPPLTPDQRLRETARILARGVLRLRASEHAHGSLIAPEDAPDPPQEGVDVSATTRPHGSAG